MSAAPTSTVPSMKELLDCVERFARAAYPDCEYASLIIRHGTGIPDTIIFATPADWRPASMPLKNAVRP
jgi:hypothetical protein